MPFVQTERTKKEKNAIPPNRSTPALPPAVRDLADVLAEIAARQLRARQAAPVRGGDHHHE